MNLLGEFIDGVSGNMISFPNLMETNSVLTGTLTSPKLQISFEYLNNFHNYLNIWKVLTSFRRTSVIGNELTSFGELP